MRRHRRPLIARLSPHRLPPAPPLDIEKRKREIAVYDAFGPEVRRLLAETPIDIDVQLMLPAYRRAYAQDRQARAFASPEGIIGDDSPAYQDRHLASWLAARIQERVEAANRAKGLPAGYKPLRGRGKQPG